MMKFKNIISKGTGVNTLRNTKQKGFTLIELLVVIAIIGLLASVVLLSLNSARQKSRDAKRLADVRQVASALELYYNDCQAYPTSTGVTLTTTLGLSSGTISSTNCSGAGAGITATGSLSGTTYIAQFPSAPSPADTPCVAGTNDYRYTSGGSTTYTVTFCLGNQTGGYGSGVRTLSEQGIK